MTGRPGERFVDPTTARGVDALIEGLVMHKMLSTTPMSRADIRAYDRIHRQILSMADMLSDGIAAQFPKRF